ncbi:hypothetical protein RIF29_10846 [Crotalaria pallida]|uniref:Uncharacterized protein n=1 Tax=Crotalaria pallida TaxID=3830 RepID=A0AAN9FVM4_CROPI
MSNIPSQQLHLRDQTRGYTEEDSEDAQSMYKCFLKTCRSVAKSYGHDIAEDSEDAQSMYKYFLKACRPVAKSYGHDIDKDREDAQSMYKYFLKACRPVAKSYGHDIAEESAFASIKYPAEENDAENESEEHDDDNSVMVDHQHKCPKLNVDEGGNGSSGSHLLAIKKASPALYAAVNVDTEMHAPAVYAVKRRGRGRKPKEVSELHVTTNPNGKSNHMASEIDKHEHAGKRRRKRAKRNVVLSAEGQTIDNEIKEESEDYGYNTPQRRRPVHNPVLNAAIFCDDNNDEANSMKDTEYKEKLMQELNKPYCQEEYDRLLKDIYDRKPAQGEKVLRGRNISYKKDYASQSYLDHHIDLKRKIDSARDDHPKVLNLLRGFFYWLMNSPQENSFKPWRVSLCLDVRPACRISRK